MCLLVNGVVLESFRLVDWQLEKYDDRLLNKLLLSTWKNISHFRLFS